MGTNGVTGIIIPLEADVIDRVFHHRPIIGMFVDRFPADLSVGDRVFLYEKGGGRVLEGEGSIAGISLETVEEVRRYGRELCLSSEELDEYANSSGRKPTDSMLVLKVRDAIKYVRPLKCSVPVTKDGAYVTNAVSAGILTENS
jgi:hypothetical protein